MILFKQVTKLMLVALLALGSTSVLAQDGTETQPSTAQITQEQALEAALTLFPDAVLDEIYLDEEDDLLVWEVEFEPNTDVYINALTGEVVKVSLSVDNAATSGTPSATIVDVDEDEVEILSDAGYVIEIPGELYGQEQATSAADAVAAAQTVYPNLRVVEVELDDDDVFYWEITFENGREVEVSAVTGNILFFGIDTPQRRNGSSDSSSAWNDTRDGSSDGSDNYDDRDYDDRDYDDNSDDRDYDDNSGNNYEDDDDDDDYGDDDDDDDYEDDDDEEYEDDDDD